ncbi:MAG: nitroreductase [bacterium]|nr:nitroreductase [bacterium]
MEFRDLVASRYSVRAYKPDLVPDDMLETVLDAACLAPTANNEQPFGIVVVHTARREAELRRVYRPRWFTQAPLVICICGLPSKAWVRRDGRSYLDVDVAIVTDHLILAAADAGLGTCWVADFDAVAAREILALPKGVEPILFTPVGWPADTPKGKQRKPISELVRYEHW